MLGARLIWTLCLASASNALMQQVWAESLPSVNKSDTKHALSSTADSLNFSASSSPSSSKTLGIILLAVAVAVACIAVFWIFFRRSRSRQSRPASVLLPIASSDELPFSTVPVAKSSQYEWSEDFVFHMDRNRVALASQQPRQVAFKVYEGANTDQPQEPVDSWPYDTSLPPSSASYYVQLSSNRSGLPPSAAQLRTQTTMPMSSQRSAQSSVSLGLSTESVKFDYRAADDYEFPSMDDTIRENSFSSEESLVL